MTMRGMALLSAVCLLCAATAIGPSGVTSLRGDGVIVIHPSAGVIWTMAGSPYHIGSNLSFSGSLTIEPGVQVFFDGNYSLYAYEGVYANGTATGPIEFLPSFDTGKPVQWGFLDLSTANYIHVRAAEGVTLEGPWGARLSFENSTVELGSFGLLGYMQGTPGIVARSTFRNLLGAALEVESFDATYSNLTIDHVGVGIALDHIGHSETGADPTNNLIDHVSVSNASIGVEVNNGTYPPPATNLLVNSSFDHSGTVFATPFSGKVYANNFENTSTDFAFTSGGIESYDNGARGNYWSRYIGTDANHDGIGDTPYGPDRYPLMAPATGAGVMTVGATTPPGPTGSESQRLLLGLVLILVAASVATVAGATAWWVTRGKKRSPPR